MKLLKETSDASLAIPQALLRCRITPADVEAMLDAYDSGMCDLTTANCLSRAVARALGRSHPIPLTRHDSWSAALLIDGHTISVPTEIITWLHCAEIGGKKGPLEFDLEISPDLLPGLTLARKTELPASHSLLAG